jgi:hypothetical protein
MSDLALAFVEAFDRRWPSEEELRGLVSRNVRFGGRPDVIRPRGSERDLDGLIAGIEAAQAAACAVAA